MASTTAPHWPPQKSVSPWASPAPTWLSKPPKSHYSLTTWPKLPHLVSLSRDAIRAIRQNLGFSLGVLAIAVGLTIPGILKPVTGVLLHELSSIPVIANSARLISKRSRAETPA
jgi:hypothetical protein